MSPPAAGGEGARLPDDLLAGLEALRPRYPTTRALLLPALHMAQRHWDGWLPPEAVEAVAAALELPPAEVWGVVTFYDLFHERPVGRHRLRVCTNVPCMLRGAEELLAALHEELGVGEGEVSGDGRCSYVHFECLGACEQAPIMMVDDDYHGDLTPDRARDLVRGLE